MPPTTTGTAPAPASRRPSSTAGHQLEMRAGQDGQPHAVDVLVDRRGDDLGRSQPDPLVDHLEAGVAGPHGDLLGAVEWPSSPGLPTSRRRRRPRSLAGARRRADGPARAPPPPRRGPDGRRDTGRGAVLTEHLAQGAGPLPRRGTGARCPQGGVHQVGAGLRIGPEPVQGRGHLVPVALLRASAGPSRRRLAPPPDPAAWITVSRSAVSGDGSVLGEAVHPDHRVLAGLDPARRTACAATSWDFM